jgi:hypothetical protein
LTKELVGFDTNQDNHDSGSSKQCKVRVCLIAQYPVVELHAQNLIALRLLVCDYLTPFHADKPSRAMLAAGSATTICELPRTSS